MENGQWTVEVLTVEVLTVDDDSGLCCINLTKYSLKVLRGN